MISSSFNTSPLCPLISGVSKTKTVEIPVEAGSRRLSVDLVLSCEAAPDLCCHLELPASTWLVDTQADTETFAELLLSGSLSFMQSRSGGFFCN